MVKIQMNGDHVYEKEYGSPPILLNFKKMKMIKKDIQVRVVVLLGITRMNLLPVMVSAEP